MTTPSIDQTTAEKLRQLVARIERLEAEKKELSEDISSVYEEAKSFGLDKPVIRKMIDNRKKDPAKLDEFNALLDLYEAAIA